MSQPFAKWMDEIETNNNHLHLTILLYPIFAIMTYLVMTKSSVWIYASYFVGFIQLVSLCSLCSLAVCISCKSWSSFKQVSIAYLIFCEFVLDWGRNFSIKVLLEKIWFRFLEVAFTSTSGVNLTRFNSLLWQMYGISQFIKIIDVDILIVGVGVGVDFGDDKQCPESQWELLYVPRCSWRFAWAEGIMILDTMFQMCFFCQSVLQWYRIIDIKWMFRKLG